MKADRNVMVTAKFLTDALALCYDLDRYDFLDDKTKALIRDVNDFVDKKVEADRRRREYGENLKASKNFPGASPVKSKDKPSTGI
jgi:hypothetical protein